MLKSLRTTKNAFSFLVNFKNNLIFVMLKDAL